MLAFPVWSFADMVMGGGGHNLWPIEQIVYGIWSLFGIAGAGLGRLAGAGSLPRGRPWHDPALDPDGSLLSR